MRQIYFHFIGSLLSFYYLVRIIITKLYDVVYIHNFIECYLSRKLKNISIVKLTTRLLHIKFKQSFSEIANTKN